MRSFAVLLAASLPWAQADLAEVSGASVRRLNTNSVALEFTVTVPGVTQAVCKTAGAPAKIVAAIDAAVLAQVKADAITAESQTFSDSIVAGTHVTTFTDAGQCAADAPGNVNFVKTYKYTFTMDTAVSAAAPTGYSNTNLLAKINASTFTDAIDAGAATLATDSAVTTAKTAHDQLAAALVTTAAAATIGDQITDATTYTTDLTLKLDVKVPKVITETCPATELFMAVLSNVVKTKLSSMAHTTALSAKSWTIGRYTGDTDDTKKQTNLSSDTAGDCGTPPGSQTAQSQFSVEFVFPLEIKEDTTSDFTTVANIDTHVNDVVLKSLDKGVASPTDLDFKADLTTATSTIVKLAENGGAKMDAWLEADTNFANFKALGNAQLTGAAVDGANVAAVTRTAGVITATIYMVVDATASTPVVSGATTQAHCNNQMAVVYLLAASVRKRINAHNGMGSLAVPTLADSHLAVKDQMGHSTPQTPCLAGGGSQNNQRLDNTEGRIKVTVDVPVPNDMSVTDAIAKLTASINAVSQSDVEDDLNAVDDDATGVAAHDFVETHLPGAPADTTKAGIIQANTDSTLANVKKAAASNFAVIDVNSDSLKTGGTDLTAVAATTQKSVSVVVKTQLKEPTNVALTYGPSGTTAVSTCKSLGFLGNVHRAATLAVVKLSDGADVSAKAHTHVASVAYQGTLPDAGSQDCGFSGGLNDNDYQGADARRQLEGEHRRLAATGSVLQTTVVITNHADDGTDRYVSLDADKGSFDADIIAEAKDITQKGHKAAVVTGFVTAMGITEGALKVDQTLAGGLATFVAIHTAATASGQKRRLTATQTFKVVTNGNTHLVSCVEYWGYMERIYNLWKADMVTAGLENVIHKAVPAAARNGATGDTWQPVCTTVAASIDAKGAWTKGTGSTDATLNADADVTFDAYVDIPAGKTAAQQKALQEALALALGTGVGATIKTSMDTVDDSTYSMMGLGTWGTAADGTSTVTSATAVGPGAWPSETVSATLHHPFFIPKATAENCVHLASTLSDLTAGMNTELRAAIAMSNIDGTTNLVTTATTNVDDTTLAVTGAIDLLDKVGGTSALGTGCGPVTGLTASGTGVTLGLTGAKDVAGLKAELPTFKIGDVEGFHVFLQFTAKYDGKAITSTGLATEIPKLYNQQEAQFNIHKKMVTAANVLIAARDAGEAKPAAIPVNADCNLAKYKTHGAFCAEPQSYTTSKKITATIAKATAEACDLSAAYITACSALFHGTVKTEVETAATAATAVTATANKLSNDDFSYIQKLPAYTGLAANCNCEETAAANGVAWHVTCTAKRQRRLSATDVDVSVTPEITIQANGNVPAAQMGTLVQTVTTEVDKVTAYDASTMLNMMQATPNYQALSSDTAKTGALDAAANAASKSEEKSKGAVGLTAAPASTASAASNAAAAALSGVAALFGLVLLA